MVCSRETYKGQEGPPENKAGGKCLLSNSFKAGISLLILILKLFVQMCMDIDMKVKSSAIRCPPC